MTGRKFATFSDQMGTGSELHCVDGVHLNYDWGYEDSKRTYPPHWEVIGPCDGSCIVEREVPPQVAELVSVFKSTGTKSKWSDGESSSAYDDLPDEVGSPESV